MANPANPIMTPGVKNRTPAKKTNPSSLSTQQSPSRFKIAAELEKPQTIFERAGKAYRAYGKSSVEKFKEPGIKNKVVGGAEMAPGIALALAPAVATTMILRQYNKKAAKKAKDPDKVPSKAVPYLVGGALGAATVINMLANQDLSSPIDIFKREARKMPQIAINDALNATEIGRTANQIGSATYNRINKQRKKQAAEDDSAIEKAEDAKNKASGKKVKKVPKKQVYNGIKKKNPMNA